VRRADLLSAAVLAAIGVYFVVAGRELGLGRLADPGSGFMIFWVGWALAGFGVAIGSSAWRAAPDGAIARLWEGADLRKVIAAVAIMAAYAALLPVAGFVITTGAMLTLLFRLIEPLAWWKAVAGAVLGTALTWVLFVRLLGTQLPAGILGDLLERG
jgi:putative tricarboxylic transport membrane protein